MEKLEFLVKRTKGASKGSGVVLRGLAEAGGSTREEVDGVNFSGLSLELNGVLDAAVNGGVHRYVNAFFSHLFLQSFGKAKAVQDLRVALAEQAIACRRGVELYNRSTAQAEELREMRRKLSRGLNAYKAMLDRVN